MKPSKYGLGEKERTEQVDITDIAEIFHQLNNRTSNDVAKPYSEYDPESIFPPPSQVSVNNDLQSDRSKSQCFVNLWKRAGTCEQKQDKEIGFSASKYEQGSKRLKKIEVQKLNFNQKMVNCEKSLLIKQEQLSNKDSIIKNNNDRDLVPMNPPPANFKITDFFLSQRVSFPKVKNEKFQIQQTQQKEKEQPGHPKQLKVCGNEYSIPHFEESKPNPLILSLMEKNDKKRKAIEELRQELKVLRLKKTQITIKFSSLKNQVKGKLKSKLLETNDIKMQYQNFKSSISSVLLESELNQRFAPHTELRLKTLQQNKKKGSQKRAHNRKQIHTDEQSVGNTDGNRQSQNSYQIPQKKQYINHWMSKLQKFRQKLSLDTKYYTCLGQLGRRPQRVSQQLIQQFESNPSLSDYVLLSVSHPLSQNPPKSDSLRQVHSFNLQSLRHQILTVLRFPKFSTQLSKSAATKHLSHLYKMSKKLHNSNGFYFLQTTVAEQTQNGEYIVYGREKMDEFEGLVAVMQKYEGLSEVMVKYIVRVCLIILEEIKVKVDMPAFFLPLNIYFSPKCDLKFSNILMNNLLLKDQFKPYLNAQNLYYFLPPQGLSQKDYSNAGIWSLGILVYFMIYEAYPFEYQEEHNFLKETFWIYNELNFPAKPVASEKLKDFITFCLTYKEKDPSLLAKHQFLNK